MPTEKPMNLPITNSRLNKTIIDKWILFFRVPDAMRQLVNDSKTGKANISTDAVQMTIKSVRVPDVRVKAISQRFGADNLHISSHSRDPYELFSINFDITNDFSNWSTFYEWMNLILDEKLAIPDPHNKINAQNIFKSDWIMVIGRIAVLLAIITKVSVNYNALRVSFFTLLGYTKDYPNWINFVLTVVILLLTTLVCVLYQSITDYISLIGSFCSVLIAFFFPGLVYLKGSERSLLHYKSILTIIGISVLCLIGFVSGFFTIKGIIDKNK
jgi:hypothetical protein